MNLLDSLLDAIVRLEGDALVMHVGEKPYVVTTSSAMNAYRGPLAWGQVELSSRVLTPDAVLGMLGQILPLDQRQALEELGAIEQEIAPPEGSEDRFTVVAARGGDDVWLEVRRHRPEPVVAAQEEAPAEQPAVVIASEPAADIHAADEWHPVQPVADPADVETAAVLDADDDSAAVADEYVSTASEDDGEDEEPFQIVAEEAQELPTSDEVDALLASSAHVLDRAVPSASSAGEQTIDLDLSDIEISAALDEQIIVDGEPSTDMAEILPEQAPARMWEHAPDLAEASQPLADTVGDARATEGDAYAEDPQPGPAAEIEPEPVIAAAEPEPVIAAAEPEPVVAATEPEPVVVATEPEPVVVATEPEPVVVATEPEPVVLATEPEPVVVAAEPEPVVVATEPEPVVMATEPEPVVLATEPEPVVVAAEPEPVVVAAEPEPVIVAVDPEPPRVVELAAEPALERSEPEPSDRPEPAVVVQMARRPVQQAPPPPPAAMPVFAIEEVLRVAAARAASTVYIVTHSQPLVRADGDISALDLGTGPLSEADVDRLVLELAPDAARDSWQRGVPAEWMCDVAGVGRVRCLTFRDHRGPGLIFRMLPPQAISADQLGLSPEVQALATQSEGLVLIAGPRASGKTTLMNAFVEVINRSRSDHVITIERQIGFVHESRRSFVSQREVRGDAEASVAAVRAALREDPDVLCIEDVRTSALAAVALEAAESGRLVFASLPAPSAVGGVERMLELLPAEGRAQAQAALAATLRGVIGQVLLRRIRGGRTAAREVLLATPASAALIQEGKINQLPLAIENGRRIGMVPLNDALAAAVRDGTVHVTEAWRKAVDKDSLLAALRRDGIDTSFAERLA